ncbi:MAG: hypothetical protein V1495_07705 [Pseudomonadota bacterium]
MKTLLVSAALLLLISACPSSDYREHEIRIAVPISPTLIEGKKTRTFARVVVATPTPIPDEPPVTYEDAPPEAEETPVEIETAEPSSP